jgi:hypothetical protein
MKILMNAVLAIAVVFLSVTGMPDRAFSAEKEDNPVLAEVGDEKITLNELKEAASGTSLRGYTGLSLEEKKKLLDNMIAYKLLYLEAKKRKLDDDPEVQQAFEVAKQEIMSRYLAKIDVLPKVQVTEEDIEKYYKENMASFNPKRATIKFFNLLSQDSSGETRKEEARKVADGILERLKKGESFEDVHASFQSESVWAESLSSPQEGEVMEGKFFTGSTFDDVVFNLKKDEFGMVELADRFLILRLDDLTIPDPPPLNKVSVAIEGNLKQKRWEKYFSEYIEELRKSIPVKKNEDLIK